MAFEDNEKDRLSALLAVALDEREAGGECPDSGRFAALMDGRLSPEERGRLLAHIDGCDACFRIWVDLRGAASAQKPLWQRYLPGIAVAACACLIFFMVQARLIQDAPHALLDNGYKTAKIRLLPGKGHAHLPWEKESGVYGFGPRIPSPPGKRAFGAGLWMGRRALSGGGPGTPPDFLLPPETGGGGTWAETKYAPFYELGRWCKLVRRASLSPVIFSEAFWDQQIRAFEGIHDGISSGNLKQPDRVTAERLRKIGLHLNKGTEMFSKRTHRKRMAAEIGILVELLSPRKPLGSRS